MYREQFVTLAACGRAELRLRQGAAEAALADFHRAWGTAQEFPRMLGRERLLTRVQAGMACAYAALGERQRAHELAREAFARLERARRELNSSLWEATTAHLYHGVAIAHLRVEETDTALSLFENAVEAGWRDARWLAADPEMKPVAGHPRFRLLREKILGCAALDFEASAATARLMLSGQTAAGGSI